MEQIRREKYYPYYHFGKIRQRYSFPRFIIMNANRWYNWRPDGSLVIHAAKLSACAGLNKWCPHSDLIDYFAATEFNSVVELKRGEKIMQDHVDIALLVQAAAENAANKMPVEADQIVATLSASDLLARLSREDAAAVMEVARSNINMARGIAAEPRIIEELTADPIALVKIVPQDGNNAQPFVVSAKPLFTCHRKSNETVQIYIGGRCDARRENGRIVEIKCRRNRFLGTPVYELVQVHAYMHIHDQQHAEIVEEFAGSRKSHRIKWDAELWHNTITCAEKFVSGLIATLESPAGESAQN